MFYLIYLSILVCISTSLAESSESDCVKKGNVYQTLDWAEQMIRSAKEKVSTMHREENTLERTQVRPEENRLEKAHNHPTITRKDLCECQDVPSLKTEENKKEDLDIGLPRDCEELLTKGQNNSGVYKIQPLNSVLSGPIKVYCDMETDGGGWTVIQRRVDSGFENRHFYRDWRAYKEGFGNLEKAFWLGNDKIYAISNQDLYSIRFDLGDFYGNKAYALYETFFIDDENNSYKLYVTNYSGNAGDSFLYHNGGKFSTRDNDNDGSGANLAETKKGAWWFKDCCHSNLNGEYRRGRTPRSYEGIVWYHFKSSSEETLSTTEMKIRKYKSSKN